MKQSFSNTSELTKLHHLSNFLVGRCPEFPYQTRSCKIIISLSIFIIICEILLKKCMQVYYKTHSVTHFFIMFLGDYDLMLAHLGVTLNFTYSYYRPKHSPIPLTNLVYTLAIITSDVFI